MTSRPERHAHASAASPASARDGADASVPARPDAAAEGAAAWDMGLTAVRDAFEHAPVGLAVLDPRGRWRHVNAALARLLEAEPGMLLGRPFAETVHPDDRARDAAALAAVAERRSLTQSQEKRLLRRDGPPVPVRQSVSAVRDPAGALHAFVLVVEDLTAARAAQAALREREIEFRAMADNIPQLAWMADAAGAIFWYNRRWYDYTGGTLGAMHGWEWRAAHHPEHVERGVRASRRRRRRHAVGGHLPAPRRDGAWRWFLSRANPIRDARGRVVRWFGTNTDVTEAREAREEAERARIGAERAREEAERANQAKSEFLAVMSHELRTPLKRHPGLRRAARPRPYGEVSPRQREILERIRQSERHLLTLVNDVLSYAKLETGRTTYALADVDVAEVLDEVAPMLTPLVGAKALTLAVEPPPAGLRVRADRDKLRQVLLNLLSNAVKFTPAGGRITLAAEDLGAEGVRLHVRDTGVGVAPELRRAIFEPFVQGDTTLTRTAGGAGLGLAIGRELATGMDGRLELTESTLGEGSTFTLALARGGPGLDGRGGAPCGARPPARRQPASGRRAAQRRRPPARAPRRRAPPGTRARSDAGAGDRRGAVMRADESAG
jgi:PAS domain S-box-containing protein